MEHWTMLREEALQAPSTAVLRIMRCLPITIPMSLHIEPKVSAGPRLSRPGLRVAVGGSIKAGGFGARLIYRRVERGTCLPIEEITSERMALAHDRSLAIQPRAIDRAVAGPPPDLWIHYLNGAGSPITAPTRLGRCDQGPFGLNPELPLSLFVDAAVLNGDMFYLNPRSRLAISGEVAIRSGITARLTLSDGDRTGDPPMMPIAAIDVPLIPENTIVRFPRRPLTSPLDRDSWLILAFLNGMGEVMGGELLLGRAQPSLAEIQSGHDLLIQTNGDRAAYAPFGEIL